MSLRSGHLKKFIKKSPNYSIMLLVWTILVVLSSSFVTTTSACAKIQSKDDYWTRRQEIIAAEEAQQLGASIQLTPNEQLANKILMEYKYQELDICFQDPGKYLPSQHFFTTRNAIHQNTIYKILREMPKGALLHTHDTATTNWDFVYQQTFEDNLYLCNDTQARLKFFQTPDTTCNHNWQLVKDLRKDYGESFENFLISHLTLIREDYDDAFSDCNKVWSTFQNIFIMVTEMLTFRPVFEAHFYATLEQLHDDNITYVEIRGTLPEVYELGGKVYSPEEIIQIYLDVAAKFQETHPRFIGVKFIYAPLRFVDDATVEKYLVTARRIKEKFPDFVVGFDLVGQEDVGRPLVDFVEMLQDLDMDFYLHAGETNWNQGLTDQNLIDAILLGTKRIGHGYALIKHPELMKEVKSQQIAIEVSPISNQVLALVRDIRNHPASVYFATNMPVVITNDDPTYWGAEGVSYDWYMAFVGMASRTADLRMLKQLAINSLEFSSLKGEEKVKAFEKWEGQWDEFIERFVGEHVNTC